MRVLGVDPGGQTTGIVVREGRDLLYHATITRSRGSGLVGWVDRVRDGLDRAAGVGFLDLLAVEGLNTPTPQMGMANVRGLIDCAAILGCVLGWADCLPTVEVPPGRHGRAAEGLGRAGLLGAYPEALVGPRESSGTGVLRHVRSAWDVAAAGIRVHRKAA